MDSFKKKCFALTGNFLVQLDHLFVCLQVTKSSERRLMHLTKASEELGKLEDEMNKFNTWMSAANSELARQEECLQRFEDLKPLAEKQKVSLWVLIGCLVSCPASLDLALPR